MEIIEWVVRQSLCPILNWNGLSRTTDHWPLWMSWTDPSRQKKTNKTGWFVFKLQTKKQNSPNRQRWRVASGDSDREREQESNRNKLAPERKWRHWNLWRKSIRLLTLTFKASVLPTPSSLVQRFLH